MNSGMSATLASYYDQDTGRTRYAALVGSVYYFAAKYGKQSALALCKRINSRG